MIINHTIEIKLNSRNIKHYISMGYILPDKPHGKKIIVDINHISNSSSVKVNAKCDYCGTIKEISYCQYRIITSKFDKFSCSNKCSNIKRKDTQIKRYGVDNYTKTDEYKNRVSKTNLEKYGVINVFQSEIIKDKIKKTNTLKYGVDNISKSKISQLNTLMGKDINYIKYIDNNISLFKCNEGHTFEISSDNYHSRFKHNTPLCTICNPIGDSSSIKEKELLEFIKLKYDKEIIQGYRDQFEIDIYLPHLKIGFEFNGLYWHSEIYKDKSYHLNKTNWFKEKGVRIVHIWEDDWDYKKDIIKSQIINIFKKSNKIYARKCIIKEVNSKDARFFLDNNHIQGFVGSNLKLGLYYKDQLVSLMSFDHFEGRNKMPNTEWNLNRFCTILNTNVVGGASKLLKYFIDNYNPSRIISYADKDLSNGSLYEILGFNKINESKPDYKYIVNKKRIHKSRYKKDNLNLDDKTKVTESQIMNEKNLPKIYDCGKIKFEYLK